MIEETADCLVTDVGATRAVLCFGIGVILIYTTHTMSHSSLAAYFKQVRIKLSLILSDIMLTPSFL